MSVIIGNKLSLALGDFVNTVLATIMGSESKAFVEERMTLIFRDWYQQYRGCMCDFKMKNFDDEHVDILQRGSLTEPMVFVDFWPPHFVGGVHDHNTWSFVASLLGTVTHQLWEDESKFDINRCLLKRASKKSVSEGNCTFLSETAIHHVANTTDQNELALTLHVYGASLLDTKRYMYYPEKGIKILNPNTEFYESINEVSGII